MDGHKRSPVVGYARVSAADQNEARQLVALGTVDRLFVDKASGKSVDRPELMSMLDYVRDGDTVRVQSPDRLARSTRDLLALLELLSTRGVEVEFTDHPGLNTGSPQGSFMLTILGAVAELERATIRERQAEGIAVARAAGVYERAPKLDAAQIENARQRIRDAGVPHSRVARELGVSRQTLYTALNGQGRYSAPR